MVAPGEVGLSPTAVAAREAAIVAASAEPAARLAPTARKEVFVFVHGVNTSFETAAVQAAGGWHFLGREGVAMLYTWPARSISPLTYAYDRESGEFTIFHLKQTLRALAATPEVEKVHVVAHSRGADVATSALRELVIEAWAGGEDPRTRFKVDNLVLIAADLDFGVVMQRLVAEALGAAVGRLGRHLPGLALRQLRQRTHHGGGRGQLATPRHAPAGVHSDPRAARQGTFRGILNHAA